MQGLGSDDHHHDHWPARATPHSSEGERSPGRRPHRDIATPDDHARTLAAELRLRLVERRRDEAASGAPAAELELTVRELVDEAAAVLSAGPARADRRADPARHRRPRAARGAARRRRGRGGDGQRPRGGLRRAPRADRAHRGPFESEQALRDAIERILAPVGRRVDELSPMADARLADGSRVNVVIPPLAVDGPALSVRRFTAVRPDPDELVAGGTLTPELVRAARARPSPARRSVLVSGGTGSGKTTLLNALSAYHRPERARGHDRGRGRAAPAPAARRPAREPSGVGRGAGRGDDPRPAPKRAADAPRPDRDRRGPRRRRRSTC